MLRSNGTHYVDSAIQAADVPTLNQSTSGNAATATALAAAPTKCNTGNYPLGVDASGNAQNCSSAASMMVYPGTGVPNSTGIAWGTSYTVGTGNNNLVQLNGSGQLPAVSAASLTNFPTLNQSTTGTAGGLTGTALGGDVTNSGNAVTIAANAVGSSKMAVVNTRRTICLPIGSKSAGAALADSDLADSDQYLVSTASTLVEITVRADGGTPNIILGRDRAGAVVNLTSAALTTAASGAVACANAGGTTGLNGATTCSATLQNTSLSAGDWILPVSGTAGGVAKQMSACLTWTVN
jgi:hypothetical protein